MKPQRAHILTYTQTDGRQCCEAKSTTMQEKVLHCKKVRTEKFCCPPRQPPPSSARPAGSGSTPGCGSLTPARRCTAPLSNSAPVNWLVTTAWPADSGLVPRCMELRRKPLMRSLRQSRTARIARYPFEARRRPIFVDEQIGVLIESSSA